VTRGSAKGGGEGEAKYQQPLNSQGAAGVHHAQVCPYTNHMRAGTGSPHAYENRHPPHTDSKKFGDVPVHTRQK
jgi:hypothetical protein